LQLHILPDNHVFLSPSSLRELTRILNEMVEESGSVMVQPHEVT
jgi:hypothetical protein